jgi:hypothetical protein
MSPDGPDVMAADVGQHIQDAALMTVGRFLQYSDYHFTTVTPDTHRIVNARPTHAEACDLTGIFGWSRPFRPGLVPEAIVEALALAEVLDHMEQGMLRSRIRFSTIGDHLIMHSSFPTDGRQSVFFGPDTYRFVDLLQRSIMGGGSLLEMGAGTGAAALSLSGRFSRLALLDINQEAVRYARINAALAGCDHAEVLCADVTHSLSGTYDAIIANPPYIIDPTGPVYRNGGWMGIEVALDMVKAALPLLAPEGQLVMYTGAPIADGHDLLEEALAPILLPTGRPAQYDELDVDVFGSSLLSPHYDHIDRIAVIALIVGRTAPISTQPYACTLTATGQG